MPPKTEILGSPLTTRHKRGLTKGRYTLPVRTARKYGPYVGVVRIGLQVRAFGVAEVATSRHLAADVSQRSYHRQSFAVAFLVLLMLVPMSRQQRVLHLLSVVRIQLSRGHHAIQHQICATDKLYIHSEP